MTTTLPDTDLSLLTRYATARDPDAFAELARRYAGMVLAAAKRITASPHDAEDITQSAFLELARNPRAVRSVPAYLHRIATTRALNLLRDNATRKANEAQLAHFTQTVTPSELLPLIDVAIEKLPDHLRTPLVLHFLQGHSQPDIARLLKISQPTISRRINEAITQLRNQLQLAAVLPATALLNQTLSQVGAQIPTPNLLASLNKLAISGIGPAKPAATLLTLTKFLLFATLIIAASLLTYLITTHNTSTPSVPTPPPSPQAAAPNSPPAASTPTTLPADQLRQQRAIKTRDIAAAVFVYASRHGGRLPADLGQCLNSFLDRKTPTQKADTFISPIDPHQPALPESPDADWVNANTSFTYLGNADIRTNDIKGSSSTVIIHEKLNLNGTPSIFLGFLDGHSELRPTAEAQKAIDDSKKKLDPNNPDHP